MIPRINNESTSDRQTFSQRLIENRRIALVVVFVLLATVSAGIVFLEESTGMDSFEIGTEEEDAMTYIEGNFSANQDQEIAQVIVRDENVLSKESLIQSLELQGEMRANETLAPTLRDERPTVGIANVIATAAIEYISSGGANPHGVENKSDGDQFTGADGSEPPLEAQISALETLDQSTIDELIQRILDREDGNSDAFVFMPNTYEGGSTTAPATMIVVFQEIEGEYPISAAPPEVVNSHLSISVIAGGYDGDIAVVGSGILTDEEQRAMGDTLSLVGPVALFLVLLILVIAYRDVVDVVLGLSGILLVQLWTFGALGWVGMDFNPVLVAVPVLLIGLSIDYCIHVFMRYREQRHDGSSEVSELPGIEAAMAAGLAGVGTALVWVTVTTSIGFLSNVASPVEPIRELGFIAAIGIVGSFVVFVLFLPPLKVELDGALERLGFDRNKPPLGTGEGVTASALSIGAVAARKTPLAVLLVVLLLTGLTTMAAANVSTSWGPEENMIDSAPAWTEHLPGDLAPGEYTAKGDYQYANEHFVRHGSEAEILVRGDVTDPGTLERVSRAEAVASEQAVAVRLASGETRTESPLSVMERVARENETFGEAFERADTTGDGIPDTALEALYDTFFAVAPDEADGVLHRSDGEYEALRMAVAVNPEAAGEDIRLQFEKVGGELQEERVVVTVTGEPIIGHIIQQHLLESLLTSLFLTLVAVLTVLVVVFRLIQGSATLGLLTILPVAAAVSWIIGTMYLLGYPLTVLNAVIASLTIGIGIDYSIHISERFRSELERQSVEAAISRTVRGTGGALLGSAATTAIGFGVLGLAIHPPLQQFGIVTAIMIGYAFVGAVFVLPSLLVLWARYVVGESPAVEGGASVGGEAMDATD